MDNSSCWCYLCSQRVTPVVESDGGIRCPHCQDRFVLRMGGRSSSPADRLPLWSSSLLGLVSGGFSALDEEVGWQREGMLFGLADFSLGGDRSDAATDFSLTLADYLLEGEEQVRCDRLRRLKLNRVRVCESAVQCCICLEGNGTCPMCRCKISAPEKPRPRGLHSHTAENETASDMEAGGCGREYRGSGTTWGVGRQCDFPAVNGCSHNVIMVTTDPNWSIV